MYFPSVRVLWLFWLAFVSVQHNQLNRSGSGSSDAYNALALLGSAEGAGPQPTLQLRTRLEPKKARRTGRSAPARRDADGRRAEKWRQSAAINSRVSGVEQQPAGLSSSPVEQQMERAVVGELDPEPGPALGAQLGAKWQPVEGVKAITAASGGNGELLAPLHAALDAGGTTTMAIATRTATAKAKTVKHAKEFLQSRNERGENILKDFRASVVKLFASDDNVDDEREFNSSATNANDGGNITTNDDGGHMTERRHILPEKLQYTKEIGIKQGRLIGIMRTFVPTTGLRAVDQYLGLPYAEAPVASRRFMPPGAPLPWQGLKIARHLPPVCPQKLPDTGIQQDGSGRLSRGYYKHLTRLLPYLKTESEDCLYLNIYVPHEVNLRQTKAFPVIVYIHGESFEWNSGNAYDGSVLASYGEVIVVTVNFRLGVLGFLRAGLSENTVANFGLLDQIAALHWIKENIASFGGDKDSVTLMGHRTGAACVNYLMVSPVAVGLFHRAILMSGSAMSDWAASNHSLQLTMQIAHTLDCPLEDEHEAMLTCLREKRYQDILRIPTSLAQFSTSLGPIVDGNVIPNQPYKAMGLNAEHFNRYDLLFGVTESESYHALGALALEEGLRENERDNLLRFYMQSRYDVRPDLALAATLKKYSDMYTNPIKASNLEHRDVVLDILSDARVVGPLMQTGLFHADVNSFNYMYVFGHNSAAGPHANIPHSIAGEELAYIFGAPLAPAGPFPTNYSAQEKLLSEAVMVYWTNFAKTGNPKAPWLGSFINLHALEWDRYDLDWPEFNKRNHFPYCNIGIPPSIGYRYRQIYMNFWNKELPDELNEIAALQQQPFLPVHPKSGRNGEVVTGHLSQFGSRDNGAEDPVHTLKLLLQEPYGSKPIQIVDSTAENMYNAPPTFGVAKHTEDDLLAMNIGSTSSNYGSDMPGSVLYGMTKKVDNAAVTAPPVGDNTGTDVIKSEATLQLLIALIVIFIVLNVIIYSTFLLHRKKKTALNKRKLGGILSYDGTTDDELKRSKHTTTQHDGEDSYILDMVRKSNTYEAVKMDRSPINGFKITRQLSSSTVDTHTKVCEWMCATADRKLGMGAPLAYAEDCSQASKKSNSPFTSLPGSSGGGGSFAKLPQKVSVGVDATPQARGSSVLGQEPIEVTKLKAEGGNIIICQEVEVADQDLLTPQNSLFASRYSLMRQHSNATTEVCDVELPPALTIAHKHSRSDPVEMYYSQLGAQEQVTSFMDAGVNRGLDINVTSRDELDETLAVQTLTPEQRLLLIKQRHYPKVLPTGLVAGAAQRDADPCPMTVDLTTTNKRYSLPPNSYNYGGGSKHLAPVPPPRISTLGRKPSLGGGRRNSNNMTTSPVMLAQDCTVEEEEPEITLNTLMVGPIVPNGAGIYSTLKRRTCTQPPDGEALERAVGEKQANDATKSMAMMVNGPRHLAPLCFLGPTSPLSFTANLPLSEQDADALPAGAHHTLKVYKIDAAVPTSNTSAHTTASQAHPLTSPMATTPRNYGIPEREPASKMAEIIYAQPMKNASKTNLTATSPAGSQIPRVIPATTPTVSAAGETIVSRNGNHISSNITPATCSGNNQMPTAPTAATAALSRIPQLNKNLNAPGLQQQLEQAQMSKPKGLAIFSPPAATAASSTSATATTDAKALSTNAAAAASEASSISLSALAAAPPTIPLATTVAATSAVVNSTRTSSLDSATSSSSAASAAPSSSAATADSDRSGSSCSSTTTSSSSSSTGTVRTELLQK